NHGALGIERSQQFSFAVREHGLLVDLQRGSMSTPITPLSDTLAVAPQLGPEDMAALKAAGYRSVIINRPDYEGGESQPTSADVIKAGEQLGLTVVYQPVVSGAMTPEDVRTFREHLDTLP